jgi:hypothetical protein
MFTGTPAREQVSRGVVLRELPSGGRRAVRIDSKIGKRFAVHRGAIQQT